MTAPVDIVTELDRTGKGVGTASVTTQSVDTDGDYIFNIQAPHAVEVSGSILSSAAGTIVLAGSMDGTNFIEDTASAVTGASATRFEFAQRWIHYRVYADADAGTANVTSTIAAFGS